MCDHTIAIEWFGREPKEAFPEYIHTYTPIGFQTTSVRIALVAW